MKRYIIGVDGGSQSTKVCIYDMDGKIVSQASAPLSPMYVPDKTIAEHPGDDLWDTLRIAGKKAMANFPGRPEEIIGLGLCTIRCCRVLMKEDGNLATPVMSWMDARLAHFYEHVDPSVRYVTTTSGYITHRLTGETKDTAANQGGGTMPYDKDTWNWIADEEQFAKFQIPKDMLFKLEVPGTILGQVSEAAAKATGFPAGIPVVATANDKAVETLGAGLEENSLLVSLGTYISSMMYGPKNISGSKYFANPASMPNVFLHESGGIRRGMWTVSWARDLFGDEIVQNAKKQGISAEEFLEQEARRVSAGSDGLITVLDWLAPNSALHKRGMLIGFDGRHKRQHIYRSVLEAIAMTMKNHSFAMMEEKNQDIKEVVISGGGSNSPLFMQIFADVYNRPVVKRVVNSSASLGAAINVAVSVGVYGDYNEAQARMVHTHSRYEPQADTVKVYKRLNEEAYRYAQEETDSLLQKIYKVFN